MKNSSNINFADAREEGETKIHKKFTDDAESLESRKFLMHV